MVKKLLGGTFTHYSNEKLKVMRNEKEIKKIVLLGASFTTRNLGVWALTSGAITSVLHSNPNVQVKLVDYHTEPLNYEIRHRTGRCYVQLINLRFSKKIWLPNNIALLILKALIIRAVPFQTIRSKFIARNFWLKQIKQADFVGSIAGGDSFSDIYGIARLIYVSLPQILTHLVGNNLVILPQTIGPFKSSLSKFIAFSILKRARKIYSRDRDSLKVVKDLLKGDNRNMEFCYDMAFVLEPILKSNRIPEWLLKSDKRIPIIGFNISGLLYMGGYTRQNMFGLKDDYRKIIHDLIKYMVEVHNAKIMLVPHVLGSVDNSESDVAACIEIYRQTKDELKEHLYVIEDEYDQHELKALIGYSDFFIGSRMHACIAALSQCIPAVGLAYSRKFRGVFESIGMEKTVIDLRTQNGKSVIATVNKIFQHRIEIKSQLEQKIPDARTAVLDLFNS
ncbi:MAG: Polysaccharide pyruvyl transferase [Candidatus Argoarchaeum ethanivorans]|uniref:Polysaccharide pyruvyl transferase n=1 Tax=Candidatus Argoarchaeum ethanivorans TaxID=2608793 RepID=A0A811ZYP4_9EURY|nr:MAG: Polysaccharide pyruvyl transferase [Candidatus Argoarchaeum ethanivorans]